MRAEPDAPPTNTCAAFPKCASASEAPSARPGGRRRRPHVQNSAHSDRSQRRLSTTHASASYSGIVGISRQFCRPSGSGASAWRTPRILAHGHVSQPDWRVIEDRLADGGIRLDPHVLDVRHHGVLGRAPRRVERIFDDGDRVREVEVVAQPRRSQGLEHVDQLGHAVVHVGFVRHHHAVLLGHRHQRPHVPDDSIELLADRRILGEMVVQRRLFMHHHDDLGARQRGELDGPGRALELRAPNPTRVCDGYAVPEVIVRAGGSVVPTIAPFVLGRGEIHRNRRKVLQPAVPHLCPERTSAVVILQPPRQQVQRAQIVRGHTLH